MTLSTGTLPKPASRFDSFAISLVINVTVVALLILFSLFARHTVAVSLPMFTSRFSIPLPPTPHRTFRAHTIIEILPSTWEAPQPSGSHATVRTHIHANTTPQMAEQSPVYTKPAPVETAHVRQPAPVAGTPQGVTTNPTVTRPPDIGVYGLFTNTVSKAPAPTEPTKPGAVTSVHFGPSYTTKSAGSPHGSVKLIGFNGAVKPPTPAPVAPPVIAKNVFHTALIVDQPMIATTKDASMTPVKVLSHPEPIYTEDARRSRIHGEVNLQVLFAADGHIQVLGIVSGLGHGLDQEAVQMAKQTHFLPATRDGKPVDVTTNYRTLFQIAD